MSGRFALLIASSHFDDKYFSRLTTPWHDVEELRTVLADPQLGDFEVGLVRDATFAEVRVSIDKFFADRRHDDVVLFYYSGHGVRDSDGRLCLAARDTALPRIFTLSAWPVHLRSSEAERHFPPTLVRPGLLTPFFPWPTQPTGSVAHSIGGSPFLSNQRDTHDFSYRAQFLRRARDTTPLLTARPLFIASLVYLDFPSSTLGTTRQAPKCDSVGHMDMLVRVFISYSHADDAYRAELEKHLALMRRQELIALWHDRQISPGDAWKGAIDKNLESADIVLLLVSADFLASDYCYDVEMQRAMVRQSEGSARLIPVIVRECDWKFAPFGKLQALPRDGRPVTSFASHDEAWSSVAAGLRAVLSATKERRLASP